MNYFFRDVQLLTSFNHAQCFTSKSYRYYSDNYISCTFIIGVRIRNMAFSLRKNSMSRFIDF